MKLIICTILLLILISDCAMNSKINRQTLVSRHNVFVTVPDSSACLSVGNGNFAFTVGITGLQNFVDYYATGIPLGTLSNWGWHTFPNPEKYELQEAAKIYKISGREVPYIHDFRGEKDTRRGKASLWLRENPQRIHLGLIRFLILKTDGAEIRPEDIQNPRQTLDLWRGEITSHFEIEGTPVAVRTVCHPIQDQMAVHVTSPLVAQGRLQIQLDFPAPDPGWRNRGTTGSENLHQTRLLQKNAEQIVLERTLDSDHYFVSCHTSASIDSLAPHRFVLAPQKSDEIFTCAVLFSPQPNQSPAGFDETCRAAEAAWEKFWNSGGAVDFGDCRDVRARELERRVILSQYLTQIQCSGDLPPQETGLTFNSWYGKFHLEMHWWHSVHFVLWNRPEVLQKQLEFYFSILDQAKATAAWQGYTGARWPKMVGPDGREGPSAVATYLIWQQPHPIYFGELLYQTSENKPETLAKYRELVFDSADFMASYARFDTAKGEYVLGPALIPAQERFSAETTINPAFELVYWHWGLQTAIRWAQRLGIEPNPRWQEVLTKLAPLAVQDSVYLFTANATDSYTNPRYLSDHPMVLGCVGMLPITEKVDLVIMKNTMQKVLDNWLWDGTWGWDYPLAAMSAAALGEAGQAIDILLMDVKKNTCLINGHNYQNEHLSLYLPGNGGLLTAIARMCTKNQFPKDGNWAVKWEDLQDF